MPANILEMEKDTGKNNLCACICSRLDNLDYIYETLNSIIRQTKKPQKILIVISGRSKKILMKKKELFVKEYLPNFNSNDQDKLYFLYTNNYGLSAARNFAINNIKEEITIFGDDDDIWHPERIERIHNKLIKTNSPSLVRHPFKNLINQEVVECKKIYNKSIRLNQGLISNYYGGGSTLAGHTNVFKVISFNESLPFCEDWDFWLRVDLANIEIHTISTPLVTYRVHENRMTGAYTKNFIWESKIRFSLIKRALNIITFSFFGFIKSFLKLIDKDMIRLIRN